MLYINTHMYIGRSTGKQILSGEKVNLFIGSGQLIRAWARVPQQIQNHHAAADHSYRGTVDTLHSCSNYEVIYFI